jgi:hypothetical protein
MQLAARVIGLPPIHVCLSNRKGILLIGVQNAQIGDSGRIWLKVNPISVVACGGVRVLTSRVTCLRLAL